MIRLSVPSEEGEPPEVFLLDVRPCGLDLTGLRELTRRVGAPPGKRNLSRSYRHPFALVAWHDRELGVDIERIGPCDDAFADLICTPTERAHLAVIEDRDRYLTSLWCAKETLAKVLGDALLYDPARLESPLVWPNYRSGALLAAPLVVPDGHVGWLVWRSSRPDASARTHP